jgi:hypothetical protein
VTLQHLIVAIDPSSQATPIGILEQFAQHLSCFHFILGLDVDDMREWFLRGNTSGDDGGTKNGSTTPFSNVTTTATKGHFDLDTIACIKNS